jgi:hypothetical protein
MPICILYVDLGIDATNDDIDQQARIAKRAREEGIYTNVICAIRGFGKDKRELSDIPEVRAFCRRLVNLAFISYLDASTSIPGATDDPDIKRAWGAAEVWLCSEGRFKDLERPDKKLLDEISKVTDEANKKADAKFGAFVDRRKKS